MKVYKVTTLIDNTYHSAFVYDTKFALTYAPDRWTCAMVGKLFAFRTLEGVRQFLSHMEEKRLEQPPRQVWEADAKHFKKCKRLLHPDITYIGGFTTEAMKNAWSTQAQFYHPAPTSSVTASAIKLMKEVKV